MAKRSGLFDWEIKSTTATELKNRPKKTETKKLEANQVKGRQ